MFLLIIQKENQREVLGRLRNSNHRFLWRWWMSTPLTEVYHLFPLEVTWSAWMKTMLILTQE